MKVFTVKTAEDMKSDILREIACTYALFGTSYADEDTISRLKTNISMPDRQFLRESEKRKYKNNVVFPYEILTSRIKEYINKCYDKIEKTEQYFLSTADCGGNTEKVKSLLKKNVEKLKQKTTQNIIYELDRQLLRNSDIKTVLINVGAEADKQAKSLDNLICYYAKIFAVYYKLNRLAEKGGVYYRIISNGNDCEECHTNVGKSIPINEASAGENFIPFHPNCDCMAEVLDKDGNFIENIGSINDLYNDENDLAQDLLDPFADTVEQVVLGDYSEKNTVSGTVGSVIVGFLLALIGLDAIFDVRDFVYDVSHYNHTKKDLLKLSLDTVSILPLIGAVTKYGGKILKIAKYGDDAIDAVKSADKISDIVDSAEDIIKHSDDIADSAEDIIKHSDDIADVGKGISKFSDEVEKFIKEEVLLKYQGEIRGAFKSDAKVTVLEKDTIVYRYHGGNAMKEGHWYTTSKTSSPVRDLALPSENTCEFVDEFIIKKGTKLLEGTVAPNFGQPGGAHQFYVPDVSNIIKK